MMNIAHLQLFVRLAQTYNISQAGADLGLSPAVASTYINKLEQSLGVRLVHRTTRKVSLTLEGEQLLPHAEDILTAVDAAYAAVGQAQGSPSGTLKISASATFGHLHLVPLLKEFMQRYPELNIDLRLTDTVVNLVEGSFDIAIRNSSLADSSLIARKLASDQRILVASPHYLAEHGTPQTPDDLNQHQCIMLSQMDTWNFHGPQGFQAFKVPARLRMDNGESVRDACVDGLGICKASLWSVYQQLKSGQLVPVLADYPLHSEAAIWAIYPSARLLPTKVRVLIDFLLEKFGEPPYWEL